MTFFSRARSKKISRLQTLALFSATFIYAPHTWAEVDSSTDLSSLNLEELMEIKISSASLEKKNIRSAPSLATIITSEEIKKMGARDLIDILQLVPGLSIATDTQGVVSIAVRGMWAHEGKVLLLLDGEEMNELSYNTIQLGNHYPVDSLDRVEVTLGPGSATHGGFAELAIINLVSKSASSLNGLVVEGKYGQTAAALSERAMGLGFGKKIGDWNVTAYSNVGQGNRSDRNYTDSNGSTANLTGNAHLNPAFVNLGASNADWSFRFIYDRYETTDLTAYGVNAPMPLNNNFQSINIGAKYSSNLSNTVSLTPELHLKNQTPWNCNNSDCTSVPQVYYDVTDQQLQSALTLRAELTPDLITYIGIEGAITRATDSSPSSLFTNGTNQVSYYRKSAFSEVDWNTPLADFTIGGRYQGQNVGGDAFVPRVSAIKQMGDFHAKILYSWGYRQPGIENLRLNPNLQSETTKVLQSEIGYNPTSNTITTLRLYTIALENPIIYGFSGNTQIYQNEANAGTYGLEWDSKIKAAQGFFDINYSYFHTRAQEPIEYQIPDHPDSLLGMANHKLALNANINLWNKDTFLNLSQIILSNRYGNDYNSNNSLSVSSFTPVYLTNLFLEKRNFFIDGLLVGVGAFNLLNQDYRYIQPYNGGHPPLPSQSRDWVLKASYQVKL